MKRMSDEEFEKVIDALEEAMASLYPYWWPKMRAELKRAREVEEENLHGWNKSMELSVINAQAYEKLEKENAELVDIITEYSVKMVDEANK